MAGPQPVGQSLPPMSLDRNEVGGGNPAQNETVDPKTGNVGEGQENQPGEPENPGFQERESNGPPAARQNTPGDPYGGHGHGPYGNHNNGGVHNNGRWDPDGRGWRGGDGDHGGNGRPGNGGGPYGRGPGNGVGNNSRPGGYDPAQAQNPGGGGKAAGGFGSELTHPLSTTLGQLGRLVSNLFTPTNSTANSPGGTTHHYDSTPTSSQYGGGQGPIRDHQAAPPLAQNTATGTAHTATDRGNVPVRADGGTHAPNGNNPAGSAGTAQAGRGEAALPTARDAAAPNGAAARGAETTAAQAGATQAQLAQLQGGAMLPAMQAAALQTLVAAQGLLLQDGAEEQAPLPQQGSAQNPRGDAAGDLLRGTLMQLPMAAGLLAAEQADEQALPNNLPNTLADPRRLAQAEQAQARAATDADAQARADQRADARNLANPRAAEALVRTDANDPRLAREAAEKTRNAAVSEGLRAQQADATKRPGLLAAMAESGSLRGSATALARHALDWVGQLAKELGLRAGEEEEGVHAMRVVAGLVIAATGVLVVIGALYALRVMLHGG